MAETAVFVGQGCQKGENYRKLPTGRSRHTRRQTKVMKELSTVRGRMKVFLGKVYDLSDPCWRVSYPDCDWEELNRPEIEQGKELATASA